MTNIGERTVDGDDLQGERVTLIISLILDYFTRK